MIWAFLPGLDPSGPRRTSWHPTRCVNPASPQVT